MESFRQYIDTTDQDHAAVNFHSPFSGVTTVHPCTSCGSIFKNHPIPPPPDSLPLPHLHRWNSDPIPITPSPENTKIDNKPISIPAPSSGRSNLERSFSDPTQAYLQCSPATVKTTGGGRRRSSLTRDCHDLNSLKKMKKRMREMLLLCDKVMSFNQEQEQEHAEAAVTVEEGSKDVSFKCECGKNYQILLIGDKCYYKI